jgi:putative transposase
VAKENKQTPEQVLNLLRPIEVAVANDKTTLTARRDDGITEKIHHHWREVYGGG